MYIIYIGLENLVYQKKKKCVNKTLERKMTKNETCKKNSVHTMSQGFTLLKEDETYVTMHKHKAS